VLDLETLLTQVAVILVAARGVGWILRRFHQPQVVGEMLAGILLGPSLLGLLAPGIESALFPEESLPHLAAVSQLGVVLFMFLMGLEVDPTHLRERGRTALATSQAGILLPLASGVLLGLFLYPSLAPPGVARSHFVLFMGTAMSITAFPVLARILDERGLSGTSLGTLALASAAVGDVFGWSILSVVVLLTRAQEVESSIATMLVALLAFAAALVFVARPLLQRLADFFVRRGALTNDLLAVVLLLALAAALASEKAGVHALFGAFALGVVVPRRSGFSRALVAKAQDLVVVLLLPIFFALTGLRTRIGLLTGAAMWADCALILFVAFAGKLGGVTIAGRLSGLSWREAGALGSLMNARGLVELVILNVGLEIGVISETLFTMMVVMALVTTLVTTPLLEWIRPREAPVLTSPHA
jgi:Kef-type K+ transport system membrane component KefB